MPQAKENKVWKATVELRYELRYAPAAPFQDQFLQQKWVEVDTGEIKWEDVPFVNEGE